MNDEPVGGRVFFSNVRRSLEEEDEIRLVSVGVDIGSSTSHLVFSRLVLERLDNRYVVSSREIVQGFQDARIRLLLNDGNRGLIFTLNRGLREARGEFIARLDADDLALPQRLERQVDDFTRHPDFVLLGTLGEHIDETGRVLGPVDLPLDSLSIRWSLLFDNCCTRSAVMFRTKVVREEFWGYE